jgi:Zn-dependent protease with chaperone function
MTGAVIAQQAPAAPMSAEAQAAAMGAQLAIQQQQAAIQQQMQQQVEAGKEQAGKNVATTAPKLKTPTKKSTVEELNQAKCGKPQGPESDGMAVACSREAAEGPQRRGPTIVPEPGSEIAPPQEAAPFEGDQPGAAGAPRSTDEGAPAPAVSGTVGGAHAATTEAPAAIASLTPQPGAEAPASIGVVREIAPPPMVLALPISSLPRPAEMLAGTLPSARLGRMRERMKKVAAKYDVSRIGDRGIGSGLDFFSLQREQALGKELAGEVESDSRLISDPEIIEYVNRVGQNLVRNSDAKVPFVIKVIDSDEVNAFALPGGYFYVNSGLILAADNEAELAGVMAHEIAHVAARHATKNETKSQILNLASIPLIFVGGPVGYAVREAMGLAIPMGYMKFSRDMEREADLLGLEYAYATGYDPQEFVRFFETIKAREKQKQSFLAKTFATHPMTGERIKRAQEEIAKYLPAKQEYIVDTSEFERVKARLAELENAHRLSTKQSPRPTLRRRDNANDGPPKLERH